MYNMILLGSRALKLTHPHLVKRQCSDFDFISTEEDCHNWVRNNIQNIEEYKVVKTADKIIVNGKTNIEFEIIKPGNSASLLQSIVENDPKSIKTSFGLIPSLDVLFAIKSSHKYKKFEDDSRRFWKTACDYHLMKLNGASIKDEHKEFIKLREKETYLNKTPSLTNQTKASFFSAAHGINYKYDHDSLHEAVKHLDMPAYKYYAKDNDEIKSDKNKFFEVSEEIRMLGAIEEAQVLYLERFAIPNNDYKENKEMFNFAVAKMASSITSGFFREWCYENIFKIVQNYNFDFMKKFKKEECFGNIKKHT